MKVNTITLDLTFEHWEERNLFAIEMKSRVAGRQIITDTDTLFDNDKGKPFATLKLTAQPGLSLVDFLDVLHDTAKARARQS